MIQTRLAASWCVLAWICASPAPAQCLSDWQDGDGLPGVGSRWANAATTWDPDGEGPQESLLVVGGDFGIAGGVVANRVAAWDGQAWRVLGDGLGVEVAALTVMDGTLYAGGLAGVCRWDGATWQTLGALHGKVRCLASYNGRLIAGGDIDASPHGWVNLVAWDGSAWEPVGGGVGGTAYALSLWNEDLVAVGSFSTAGGVSCSKAARWDGTAWHAFAYVPGDVYAATTWKGNLVIGGDFRDTVSGVESIAVWDGAAWQPRPYHVSGPVYALSVYEGDLVMAGSFAIQGNTLPPVPSGFIARDDGTGWQRMITVWSGREFRALTTYEGRLVAAGDFTHINDAGCLNVVAWDGSDWNGLGRGMNAGVRALLVGDGQVYTGGLFTSAGTSQARHLARMNGTDWEPLDIPYGSSQLALGWSQGGLIATRRANSSGSKIQVIRRSAGGWEAMGGDLSGGVPAVYAFVMHDETLIAGGSFTTSGSTTLNRIARFNGSAWEPLGSGMDATVRALASYDGELIAGGDFTQAGGVTCNGIARWNSLEWEPLGTGVQGCVRSSCKPNVRALYVWGDKLLAGGNFITAGGVTCNHLAAWDGSGWSSLDAEMDYPINALASLGGRLVAGGEFSTAGGTPAAGLAAWDGEVWSPLGSGASFVYALAVQNGALLVGGDFTTAGGRASAYFARWGPVGPFEPGDFNQDCLVNVDDVALLAACRTGPAIPLMNPACRNMDLDGDTDVDQSDFGILQRGMAARVPAGR